MAAPAGCNVDRTPGWGPGIARFRKTCKSCPIASTSSQLAPVFAASAVSSQAWRSALNAAVSTVISSSESSKVTHCPARAFGQHVYVDVDVNQDFHSCSLRVMASRMRALSALMGLAGCLPTSVKRAGSTTTCAYCWPNAAWAVISCLVWTCSVPFCSKRRCSSRSRVSSVGRSLSHIKVRSCSTRSVVVAIAMLTSTISPTALTGDLAVAARMCRTRKTCTVPLSSQDHIPSSSVASRGMESPWYTATTLRGEKMKKWGQQRQRGQSDILHCPVPGTTGASALQETGVSQSRPSSACVVSPCHIRHDHSNKVQDSGTTSASGGAGFFTNLQSVFGTDFIAQYLTLMCDTPRDLLVCIYTLSIQPAQCPSETMLYRHRLSRPLAIDKPLNDAAVLPPSFGRSQGHAVF